MFYSVSVGEACGCTYLSKIGGNVKFEQKLKNRNKISKKTCLDTRVPKPKYSMFFLFSLFGVENPLQKTGKIDQKCHFYTNILKSTLNTEIEISFFLKW